MPDTQTKVKRNESGAAGLSEEEKAAARDRVKELKAEQKRGANREAGLKDLLDKVAAMPEPDRVMAERVHAIVMETAPDLMPKTWYGMPAYAKDGKLICFFQAADKFKARYATFGFDENANIDEGNMWPTSWALTKLTPTEEKKIAALVRKAVS
jgi:uncharacterized protein YdhG (YjbR/CyaY superfamily)